MGDDGTGGAESHLEMIFSLRKKKKKKQLNLPLVSSPDLHPSSALVVSSKIHVKTKHIHRIHIHRVPSFHPSKWTRQKKRKRLSQRMDVKSEEDLTRF